MGQNSLKMYGEIYENIKIAKKNDKKQSDRHEYFLGLISLSN